MIALLALLLAAGPDRAEVWRAAAQQRNARWTAYASFAEAMSASP